MTRKTAGRTLVAATLALLLPPLVVPLVLGGPARRAYQDLIGKALTTLPGGTVIRDHYDRGWFSARASTELAIPDPAAAGMGGGQSDTGLRSLRIDSQIAYGPHLWFSGPGLPPLAQVWTRVEWRDAQLRLPTLLVRTRLEANGEALAQVTTAAPTESDPGESDPGEGLRLVDGGLTGTVSYRPGRVGTPDQPPPEISIDLHLPGLVLQVPGGDLASLTEAHLTAEARGWLGDLYTGSARLELGSARLAAAPDATSLQGVSVTWSQAPAGRTLDLQVRLRAEAFSLGARAYRMANLGLSAHSLDALRLAELATALRALASDTYPQAQRGLVGLTLLTQLVPRFLAPGPRLSLDSFSLTTPEGPVHAHLSVGIPPQPGSAAGPYPDPLGWIAALTGEGELELPEPVALDWLARTALPPGTSPRARLQDWRNGGWVSTAQGQVRSGFRLRDGLLSLNGQPIPLGLADQR